MVSKGNEMIADKLEDTLNGGYKGVYGEVVEADCYRIREPMPIPDVIFDLGANIGVFTRFARELFPNALIVCIEPDAGNFKNLIKFTPPENIVMINKAIGNDGTVWHYKDAINGSHECYLSDGLWYEKNLLADEEMIGGCIEIANVETTMPDKLVKEYVKHGQTYMFKIDIEGNENTLWSHDGTMNALKNASYICMEIHYYALHGAALHEVKKKTIDALTELQKTHWCLLQHTMFFALKKQEIC
jgi:FkbM family methyltransferase